MTLEELYDRYGDRMYHFLTLRLGSAEDAEDILQETFCRLARYSIRWAFIRHPRAFVFRTARNEANRFLAKRMARRKDLISTHGGPDQPAAGAMQPFADSTSAITGALEALPDEQKEVVILKVFQDLTFREIAAVCGVSANTAASRYRYGIEKLRSCLEEKK